MNDVLPAAVPPDDEGMTVRLAVGIMRAALDCIIVIDHQSRIVEWNEAAVLTFGYSRQEAVGHDLANLIIPLPLRAAHYAGLVHYLQTRSGPILNQRVEVTAIRRGGQEFPVELAVAPIDENPPRFAAYLRDISARKASEAALIESETRQRLFLRDILLSVTEGRLRFCDTPADLPARQPFLGAPIPLVLSALRPLRKQMAQAASSAGFTIERTNDLLTAASEVAMNAIVHAGGGIAVVGANPQNGVVQVWVEDFGSGIDMSHLSRATFFRDYTTAATFGRGFKLTPSTADTVWLLTGSAGTTVVIEQNRYVPLPLWIKA